MKKIYIIMALILMGMTAMAQTSVWDGKKAIWTQGSGTESDPYKIESAQQLAFLSYAVNKGYDFTEYHFLLTTDIDLNGNANQRWIPIGLLDYTVNDDGCERGKTNYVRTIFRGHFDGGGHSISNIYVDVSEGGYGNYAGLFGYVDFAIIENVFVTSGFIKGPCCGGIVADGRSTTTVSHCWNGAAIEATERGGGIVGANALQVYNCYNVGTINGFRVGGIVGVVVSGQTTIEECYNEGAITGTFAGGIHGYSQMRKVTINNSYNKGTVEANETYGSPGNMPGGAAAGGIAGYMLRGGGSITNCYNVGAVSSTQIAGCIIGYANTVTVENCNYVNTCDAGGEGTPLDIDYMRSQEYVDYLNSLNRDQIWVRDVTNINDGFPILTENVSSVEVTASPTEGGVVEGGGTCSFGAMMTLKATANEGYTFVNWTLGEKVLSSEPTYSFNVAESGNYVAHFVLNDYKVTVETNPTDGGEVTGAGTYKHGASATVTVKPKAEYQLSYWSKDGEKVSEELSYTFIVTNDCQLVAHLSGSDVNEWDASPLKVYPNPTQGAFTVEGFGTIVVSNLLGQTVLTREIDGRAIMELPQGVYFVTLGSVTRKIVVE